MKSRFIIQLTKMWGWQIDYFKTQLIAKYMKIIYIHSAEIGSGTSWVHRSLYLLCQLTTDQIKRQLQHETWQKWCQASGQHERTTQPQKKKTNRKNHMYRTPTFVLNSKCTEIKFKPSLNFIFLKYLKTEFVLRGVRIWKVIIMLLIYVGNILKDIILWEYLAHLQ